MKNLLRQLYFFILSLFISSFTIELYAQGDEDIDSLLRLYANQSLPSEERLQILFELSDNPKTSPSDRIKYAEELIILANELNNPRFRMMGYKNKAYAYNKLSEYDSDIRETLEAIAIADSLDDPFEAALYNHLGYTYSKVFNEDEAEQSFRKALSIYSALEEEDQNYIHLGSYFFNLSDFYLRKEQPDSAYKYLRLSKEAFAKINDSSYIHYLNGNLGAYFLKSGDLDRAKPLLTESAMKLYEEDAKASMEYYNYLTDLAQKEGNKDEALKYAETALEIGQRLKLQLELSDTYLNLYEIYLSREDHAQALEYYKAYKSYYESVFNPPTFQRMANDRRQFELAKKEQELEIEQLKTKTQKYIYAGVVAILVLLIGGMFNRIRYVRKTSSIIEEEKERSDQLLKNILPDETADELKAFGKVTAKQFDSVTVLFADFCGFTKHTSKMGPQELVERVDFYFSKFDEIMEKYDLEKIKTIGDAYMCAGGLPFPSHDHAMRMVMAAFEMLEFAQQFKEEDPDDPTRFDIRIGINTGPVIAGVVGTKKFVYDIWGDTVNIASRMESNSQAGQINISADTYQLIKNKLDCTYRGEVDVKNKGMMKMYFIDPLNKVQKDDLLKNHRVTA